MYRTCFKLCIWASHACIDSKDTWHATESINVTWITLVKWERNLIDSKGLLRRRKDDDGVLMMVSWGCCRAKKSNSRLKKSEKTSPAVSTRVPLSKEIEVYILALLHGNWRKRRPSKMVEVKRILSQLARWYRAIQASSSSLSERLFSKAGQVSTPARAQL